MKKEVNEFKKYLEDEMTRVDKDLNSDRFKVYEMMCTAVIPTRAALTLEDVYMKFLKTFSEFID